MRTVRIDACTKWCLAASVALMRRAASAPHVQVINLRNVDPVVQAGSAAVAQAPLVGTSGAYPIDTADPVRRQAGPADAHA